MRWFAAVVLATAACTPRSASRETEPAAALTLQSQASGTTALLQAVSAPSDRVAWVSGHSAAVLRTVDGGATWERVTVPGAAADSLQFRDVHAVNADVAYLLAAGPGTRSRIYKTTDGGGTWQLQFTNADSSAFYDCFAFWDASHGLVFSDAVAGHFVIRVTTDGGAHWTPVTADAMPPAQRGEGAFAASGTCVVTLDQRHAWVGTGAADTARVLHTRDGGLSWDVVVTPLAGGPSAGIAALAFRDSLHGIALGGDVADVSARTDNVAVTADGGRTWRVGGRPRFSGAVYGAAIVPGRPGWVVAVGPQGLDYSTDDGTTWTTLDTLGYWSVGFGSRTMGWAVGPSGRITLIRLP
ncbi:MAG TPA: hypothetical protein VLB49_09330 [Gemmatimonadales bacterium]|nr:hypothetical protein [Gemmatimonadales bacterium]